jgi:hypothetical protein
MGLHGPKYKINYYYRTTEENLKRVTFYEL